MITQMRALDSKVELITNGTLLTEELSMQLVKAGLDKLWFSIDGAKPESYSDVHSSFHFSITGIGATKYSLTHGWQTATDDLCQKNIHGA